MSDELTQGKIDHLRKMAELTRHGPWININPAHVLLVLDALAAARQQATDAAAARFNADVWQGMYHTQRKRHETYRNRALALAKRYRMWRDAMDYSVQTAKIWYRRCKDTELAADDFRSRATAAEQDAARLRALLERSLGTYAYHDTATCLADDMGDMGSRKPCLCGYNDWREEVDAALASLAQPSGAETAQGAAFLGDRECIVCQQYNLVKRIMDAIDAQPDSGGAIYDDAITEIYNVADVALNTLRHEHQDDDAAALTQRAGGEGSER